MEQFSLGMRPSLQWAPGVGIAAGQASSDRLSAGVWPECEVEAGSGLGWVEALCGAELLRSLGAWTPTEAVELHPPAPARPV